MMASKKKKKPYCTQRDCHFLFGEMWCHRKATESWTVADLVPEVQTSSGVTQLVMGRNDVFIIVINICIVTYYFFSQQMPYKCYTLRLCNTNYVTFIIAVMLSYYCPSCVSYSNVWHILKANLFKSQSCVPWNPLVNNCKFLFFGRLFALCEGVCGSEVSWSLTDVAWLSIGKTKLITQLSARWYNRYNSL